MSTEIINSFSIIEATCGQCPNRKFCAFGKPALKTLDSLTNEQEKSIAISYIWDKRDIAECPNPKVIFQAVSSLKKS